MLSVVGLYFSNSDPARGPSGARPNYLVCHGHCHTWPRGGGAAKTRKTQCPGRPDRSLDVSPPPGPWHVAHFARMPAMKPRRMRAAPVCGALSKRLSCTQGPIDWPHARYRTRPAGDRGTGTRCRMAVASGQRPDHRDSQRAADLLQAIARDLHRADLAPLWTELRALCNWLGESDAISDYADLAGAYRSRIGVHDHPTDGAAYLRGLLAIARGLV